MKLTINNTEKLPHLEREEITAMIEFEGNTPSRKEIRKAVADKQDAKEELVFIRNVYTEFGNAKAKVMACVYSSKEAMEKVEQKYMVEKHKVEESEEPETSESTEESEAPDESSEESEDSSEESAEEDSDESKEE